jgi:DNA-binding CsgD family transcriptional regulator
MDSDQRQGEGMICEQDARALVRLLGEVGGMNADVPTRKRRLMSGLGELVGADAWIWAVSRYGPDKGPPMCVSFLHSGFSERDVGLIMEATQDPECQAPDTAAWVREIQHGRLITRVRRDMVDDQTWYASDSYALYQKTVGIDDYLCSVYPLGEGIFSTVGFHREIGRACFSSRDRRLAHIVASEIPWLHREGVPLDSGDRVPELSPRLRTVFGLLLEGWSRQQMADHLGLSAHTIADYIKGVYRHFGVGSQLALIQRFRIGDGLDLPALRSEGGASERPQVVGA